MSRSEDMPLPLPQMRLVRQQYRVTSTSAIAKRKPGGVDYNAGVLMEGKTMDEAAEELFNMVLKVAGGEIQTVAEANRYRQIGFFRDGATH